MIIFVLVDEIASQSGVYHETIVKKEDEEFLQSKKRAFQNMLEMREQSSYLKDLDYKKVMEEVIAETHSEENK